MNNQPAPSPHGGEPSLFARRLLAISGSLALIVFLVVGFAFNGWAYSWIAFLVPPLLERWYAIQDRQGYGQVTEKTQPYPYQADAIDKADGESPST